MKISIADRYSNAKQLAELFQRNLTTDYISHGELQGYRAIGPGQWTRNISSRMHREIRERLARPLNSFPTKRNWRGVLEASENGRLIGLALVTISREAAVPFGIVEDIIIERSLRGAGRGEMMMRWITNRFRRSGVKRAFLESGIGNEHAHHLFERMGFQPISIVMMMELKAGTVYQRTIHTRSSGS